MEEVAQTEVKVKKPRKPRKKKEVIIPVSPFKKDTDTMYYGSTPVLVKWRDWLLICSLVKGSDTFKSLYKKESFKWGDLEESGYIYPVYTKEPTEIKNLDGKVVETIPGIYDEDLTMVLPPKFIFAIYRRYLISQQSLAGYIQKIEQMPFSGYKYETKFPPRDEQIELSNIAGKALEEKKYLNGIIQCPPGWGKATGVEDIIPTPDGWRRFGDLVVGDKVFSRDGEPTKVTAIYPQGKIFKYTICFGDGSKSEASGEHLWFVYDNDSRKGKNDVLTTQQILDSKYKRREEKRKGSGTFSDRYKFSIPLCEPVNYSRSVSKDGYNIGLSPLEHCIHPLAMGLMLGDGTFRIPFNGFGFADKFDKNIKKLKSSLLENGYLDDISFSDKTKDGNGYRFSSAKFKNIITIFGLDDKLSTEKHIPKEYLYGSIESRRLLLEGLIATDGYTKTKSSWVYDTSSAILKDDIVELSRSLGYYVTVSSRVNRKYTHNGITKINPNTSWQININHEKRKKPITDIIIHEEKVEMQCISVDNPERLYLINDFTVTHNTFISINIGSQVNGQVMIVVPNNLLKEQWIKSIVEFTDLEEEDIGIVHGSDIEKIIKKGHMAKPVLICLIQSLDSQLKRLDPHVLSNHYRNVSAVFYDETHTSGAADGYAKTTGIFTTFNIIGLSATPYKKDKNLFQLYTGIGTIFYLSTHQNLIPAINMHLLPIQISEKDRRNLFDIFEKTNYNFFMSQLEDFLFKDHYYFQYITDWVYHRFSQGYSTVIIFKTNKMLEKLERYIHEKHEALSKESNEEVALPKTVILTNSTAKKNKGELHTADAVLTNFKMFSAGADFPHLSCVFFASMVLGKIPIIQTLGRVTRKYAEKNQDVQAHFLLAKFIYPLYSSNEPHLTISRAVKLQYPEAQFKWDKGFTDFFEEKRLAAEGLNSTDYSNFQKDQAGNVPVNGTKGNGSYHVQGGYAKNNRLASHMAEKNRTIDPANPFNRPNHPGQLPSS